MRFSKPKRMGSAGSKPAAKKKAAGPKPKAKAGSYSKYKGIRKDFENPKLPQDFTPAKIEQYKKQNLSKISAVENAGKLESADIVVEWRGQTAHATVRYAYKDSDGKIKYGERTAKAGGGGYDKESAAISGALNASPEFLKLAFDAREKGNDPGYGVTLSKGQASTPYYGEGVGVSSTRASLKRMGYDMEQVADTKTASVYTLRKAKKTTASGKK